MKVCRSPIVALAVALFVGACAGTPGPGESGYAYNLSGTYTGMLDVEGMGIPTTLEVSTARGGGVTGVFTASGLGPVRGQMTGTVVDDQLTFRITYDRTAEGCSGTASGTATIETGGGEFSGSVTIDDNCDGMLGAYLRLTRR